MWPEIQAALVTGKKLKEIWGAAQQDGLDIPYERFRVYVWRARRRQAAQASQGSRQPGDTSVVVPVSADNEVAPTRPKIDPLYNVRMQLEKKRQSHFEYNPFPDPRDNIK